MCEIARQHGGYVLTTDPLSIDLHCFRRLTGQARAATDPLEADALFEKALAMWRGVPFASLDTPWLNDVRTALETERLAAALDRNDAGLRVGRHGELLPQVTAMASDHPLDERLAGQLMLAQFRCGRQADALETYRAMRERLIEELGADPSPALRQVHQQILDGDPGHHVPSPAPRASGTTRPRGSVPRRATSFVGREDDITSVAGAVGEGPLVTLTGVGGVGKTRLALEVASRLEEQFDDGACFCELAPLDDGSAVSHAVAAALRLQQQQGLGIEATVIEFLRTQHAVAGRGQLRARPTRGRAAWSTRSCGIARMWSCWQRAGKHSGWRASGSCRFRRCRSRMPRRCSPNGPGQAGPISTSTMSRWARSAEICRRLDGLPLAIELAAARMRAMSSLDVARRLDRLRLLSGGARDASPRQQSLVATIDWSYRLLTEAEQALFMRLSVFAGGFDLDAAHGVCGADGDTEDDTLDLLTGLLDKSMVKMRSGADRSRYFVLETLRAYGRDRLRENGIADECASRHAKYYTALAEHAAIGMHGPDEGAWVERMLPDFDNLRVAFEHAIAVRDMDTALLLVTSLSEFVHLRIGYESSGWAERAVELAEPGHPLYAAAVGFAARGAWNKGEFDRARSLAEPRARACAGSRQRSRRLPGRRPRGLGVVRG